MFLDGGFAGSDPSDGLALPDEDFEGSSLSDDD